MFVRQIESRDFDQVIELARTMKEEAPCYRDYAFNQYKVAGLCQVCLDDPDWICIVTENDDGELVGFTAAGCVEMLFGHDRFVEDLCFYVQPKYRGSSAALRMMNMLESWSTSIGAKAMRLGITTGTNPAQAGKFLTRQGFSETGGLYTKTICPLP